MIKYKITVMNDHHKLSESLEADSLFLSHENVELMDRIQQVVQKFQAHTKQEVESAKVGITPWEV